MKKLVLQKISFFPVFCLLLLALSHTEANAQTSPSLRPPATPLVACDPYFSVWSPGDKLTDANTVHWTGKPNRLTSLVRIDGKTFRLMGSEPKELAALPQTKVEVLPTRTIYSFEGEGIKLLLTFMTPALPDDIDLLSRPVTYVSYEVSAIDSNSHKVQLYLDASAELTVNSRDQKVVLSTESYGNITALKLGSEEQPILGKRGDDIRIDWGHLYIAAPKAASTAFKTSSRTESISTFMESSVAKSSPKRGGNAAEDVGAISFDLGKVSAKPVTRWLILANSSS